MSDAKTIGNRLVELCREGKHLQAIDELYSSDIVSVEAKASGDESMPRIMEGIEAVIGKNQWWVENHEIHASEVSGPFPHGDDRFAAIFNFDVTNTLINQRFKMEEVAVYTVADGKIRLEEFFYATE